MSNFLDNVALLDDTDVAIDPDTYQGQTNPAPPAPGVYGFKTKSLDFAKTKDGQLIKDKLIYPRLVLEQVQIVDPDDLTRMVMLYQRIFSTPFERVPGKVSSMAGDFLYSYDATSRVTIKGLCESLFQHTAQSDVFYGRLDWEATDVTWVNEQIDKQNLSKDNPAHKAAINALWKQGGVKTFSKFPRLPISYSHVWIGPSGMQVEARPYISRFFSTNEKLPKLGPDSKFTPF
jgi:hypothetical protein